MIPKKMIPKKMIPGEIIHAASDIDLNADRKPITLKIANTGDRPIQVGSHYHFYEVNSELDFDRQQARGKRLNIAAGTAVRFEPGQARDVELIPVSGRRHIVGFRNLVDGDLDVT